MMTSSNGNIFRVTGPLCGEFSPVPVNSPHKGQWRGALMFSLICVWINGWVNNREAGHLRRHRGHYDVIVMNHIEWHLWHLQKATQVHTVSTSKYIVVSCTWLFISEFWNCQISLLLQCTERILSAILFQGLPNLLKSIQLPDLFVHCLC